MKATISETAILRSILDYLAARHVLAFRMQTGADMREYKGKKRRVRYGVPGMADILAFAADILAFATVKINPSLNCKLLLPALPIRSLTIWIEVKSATGKQSELQKSFQRQVEEHGHLYVLARSIEDVEAALK